MQAKKVSEYWDKQSKGSAAPSKFVWVKKVERDLQQGKSVKEFTAHAQHEKHLERMVSGRNQGVLREALPGGVLQC